MRHIQLKWHTKLRRRLEVTAIEQQSCVRTAKYNADAHGVHYTAKSSQLVIPRKVVVTHKAAHTHDDLAGSAFVQRVGSLMGSPCHAAHRNK